MFNRDDIFEDYMGVQFREGAEAYKKGISAQANPYHPDSEMGKAWMDGHKEEHAMNESHLQLPTDPQ